MNLAKIDLNLVLSLQILLQEKNVTRAAKRLRLSQPAVSACLAKLREYFNDPLLVRVGRQYELTALALSLQPEIDATIARLEQLFEAPQNENIFGQKRTFRIAARDYMTLLLLPDLLEAIALTAPDFTVCFSRVDSDSMKTLAEGGLDFVIMPELSAHSFPSTHLFEDEWMCVTSADNPQVGQSLTEAQYLELEHLIFMPGPGKRIATVPQVSQVASKRRALAAVDDFALIPFLLAGTQLVATIPAQLAKLLANRADLKLVSPPHHIAPLSQKICWNPRTSHDPAHQWLLSQIVNIAQKFEAQTAD